MKGFFMVSKSIPGSYCSVAPVNYCLKEYRNIGHYDLADGQTETE
jgi:hypothetical protein